MESPKDRWPLHLLLTMPLLVVCLFVVWFSHFAAQDEIAENRVVVEKLRSEFEGLRNDIAGLRREHEMLQAQVKLLSLRDKLVTNKFETVELEMEVFRKEIKLVRIIANKLQTDFFP